ncbi:MAG: hypothetical protein M3Y40_00690, partial [Chloroflexota bacterium]|nr:hypothetical protein [Chloroflexota bacterium]
MLSLLLLLQVSAGRVPSAAPDTANSDTLPRVTLAEALRRSARLDPDYVRAVGQIEDAEWGRRAARLAFILPSVELGLDETKYNQAFFNPADPATPTSTLVIG